MWIRSQDKELLVNVDKFNVAEEDYHHTFTINSAIGNSSYYELGEYKTKERAIEVLDEIQKAIEDLSTDATMYEVMMKPEINYHKD